MRKLLLAIAAAMALFTVGAFAASFAVSSEDIASGGDAVLACASNVQIEFNDAKVDGNGVWTVDGATAIFSGTGAHCENATATLALKVGAADAVTSPEATVGADNTVDFTFDATTVKSIVGASVMVDGKFLAPSNF
jgi:hypothetical protein